MKEKTSKKSIYLMIIGVLTLLVLVGTATYAYFQIQVSGNSTNTSLRTNVEDGIGVFKIEGGEQSLSLNLTKDNMAKTSQGTYDATATGGAKTAHVGTLSKTEANLGRTYTCIFDVVASASINKTIQSTDNSKFVISSTSPNVTFSDDGGTTYKSTIEKPWTDLSSQQTYKGKWISGLDDAENAFVDVQASIENINGNQNHLAGLNGSLSFELQNMTCTSNSNVTATRGESPIKVTLSNVANESTLRSNLPSELTQDQIDNAKLVEVTVPSGSGNVSITIDVSGFAKNGETVVLYYYNGSSYDATVTAVVTDGKVTATFASLSPIAFVNKGKYSDSTLNGADPVLGQGMIPVTIANDGKVTYADTSKGWYNYGKDNYTDTSNNNNVIPAKTWANAVMLNSDVSATDYQVGQEIDNNDIANYLVWIPRYEYQLFNIDFTAVQSQEINIHFGSIANMPDVVGQRNGHWLTHPAFTTFNSNGFWIGKFELTKASSNTAIETKPNLDAVDSIRVFNFFTRMYNFSRSTTPSLNNDSHMIKNTEWGAIAYLSRSEFGINDQVWKNDFGGASSGKPTMTGCTGINEEGVSSATTCVTPYGSGATFYGGSTTGNISGVFDMSGGVWEYTTGYLKDYFASSGFTSETIKEYNSKYFDIYEAANQNSSQLGDALAETRTTTSGNNQQWYGDDTYFVTTSYPWFRRGGRAGISSPVSGQFAYSDTSGNANWNTGSRLVLCPVS